MGRLFWKVFFFVWLAQVSTTIGVVALFHAENQHRENHRPPPPPPDWSHGERPTFMHGEPPPPPPGNSPPEPPPARIPIQPLAVGLIASLIFSALLARYLSRPISSLRTAFAVAASGDLKVRAASGDSRRDELADLCRHFDDMVARLDALIGGQRRLLHDVSHELRSPLARLQAAIDIACRQPEKQAETLERIRKESSRIDVLIGELLTLSRLEAGTLQRHDEEIDLPELLDDLCEDARFEAQGKGIDFDWTTSPGTILGDGSLLHRAIENVVRNAIKYAPQGGRVRIAMAVDGKGTRIRVDDDGPGVDESELESIFEPFHRGLRTRNQDGFGLGLAIARQIIGAMGGRIIGRNRPGGGFSVEIQLPTQ